MPFDVQASWIEGSRFPAEIVKFGRARTPQPGKVTMPRKPNYEFERRERDRLKAIRNAEKADAKREARERAKAEAADAPPDSDPTKAS